MPPQLPRPFLGALPLRPAHQTLPASRILPTTATTKRAFRIPPEAPSYLPPPMPPQSEPYSPPKRERGHLPVPRKVFRNERVVMKKLHPDYVWKTYPLPLHPKRLETDLPPAGETPHKERVMRWRDRHTEFRRENMLAGVQALADRKLRREKEAARAAKKRHERAIDFIRRSEEDESERVTRPTIHAAVLDMSVKEDPMRFERADESRKRTEAMYERHRVARKDALTQLYVNAKHFIVSEKELEKTVMELFTADYYENNASVGLAEDKNIWGTGMRPDLRTARKSEEYRVTEMLSETTRQSALGMERMGKVAEQLTGGKLVQ